MNQDNYVTQPMAQRLVDAGFVLDTEAVWFHFKGGWELLHRNWNDYIHIDLIPAPSFAELWRELPEETQIKECGRVPLLMWKEDKLFCCCYGSDTNEIWFGEKRSTNPADALAELLIWTK